MAHRLDFPGLEFGLRNLKKSVECLRSQLDDPKFIRVRVLHSLASDLIRNARYLYASGHHLDAVRAPLCEAAECFNKVLEHRGNIPAFQFEQLDTTTGNSTVANANSFSTTNSFDNLKYVYTALSAGDAKLGKQLAAKIWDPPDASYLGEDSLVCSFWQQNLAYSVKEYLAGDLKAAKDRIEKVNAPHESLAGLESAMLLCIYQNGSEFPKCLKSYLSRHQSVFKREPKINLIFSSVALGIVSMAMDAGVVHLEDLPQDNVFLPLEPAKSGTHKVQLSKLIQNVGAPTGLAAYTLFGSGCFHGSR